jgi:hypothetical protein
MRAPVWGFSFVFLLAVISTRPAHGQAVISTRAGLVHYFEGAVYVAGQPLESHFGRFASIPEGAELRTEQGRAEVLLTPGVFLRVGDHSTIRMIGNALPDTRLELLTGSAIVESSEPGEGTSVTLIYKGWSLHQAHAGEYRLDCDPPRLLVQKGEVEASATGDKAPISVKQGMEVQLTARLEPEKSSSEVRDALTEWADGRAESISADNTIAANIQDPASMPVSDLMPDGLTYFPMLGIPSYGSSLSGYGLTNPYQPGVYGLSPLYQPGFYSIYLPGYSRAPLLLGLHGIGIGPGLQHSLLPPTRIAPPISPLPHLPISRPTPVHSAPIGGGVHVGGRR